MRLILSFALVLLLCTGAWAHEGMLALFTDMTVSDCDAEAAQYGSVDMLLFYLRGDGPEIGHAWEFRLERSSSNIYFSTPTWNPLVVVTLGSLGEGISVAASECIGTDLDVVHLGTIPVVNLGPAITYTITVVEDAAALPNPGIIITLCDEVNSTYAVGGGEFVLNGMCVPPEVTTAIGESSWGAIKSLYGE